MRSLVAALAALGILAALPLVAAPPLDPSAAPPVELLVHEGNVALLHLPPGGEAHPVILVFPDGRWRPGGQEELIDQFLGAGLAVVEHVAGPEHALGEAIWLDPRIDRRRMAAAGTGLGGLVVGFLPDALRARAMLGADCDRLPAAPPGGKLLHDATPGAACRRRIEGWLDQGANLVGIRPGAAASRIADLMAEALLAP